MIARGLLITCWHCVSAPLGGEEQYAVLVEEAKDVYRAVPLVNVEQDANKSDLATANVALEPALGLKLATGDVAYGTDVWTFGYPLTDVRAHAEVGRQFVLNGRYLQGYVTRSFFNDHALYGKVPSYELDMAAPEGLSGAPLVKVGFPEIVGVIYGSNDVASIEYLARIDSETGKREPEVQRLISFALAHYTETLRNLRGRATDGLALAEYLTRTKD